METDCTLLNASVPNVGAYNSTPRARLRQFLLYDDYFAGLAGRWLGGEITRLLEPACETSLEMWKTDLATRSGRLRDMTLQDAGEADILIVSVSEVCAPDPTALQWLDALVPWKANRAHRGLLLVLLGVEGCEVEELTAFGECLAQFARRADLAFAWQPMGVRSVGDSNWVMPLLRRVAEDRGIYC